MSQQTTASTERIEVQGEHLIGKVKELIHEGTVQRIVINDADGKPVLDMPVTVGVIGLLVAPSITAIGTLGFASHYSIDIERQHAETTAPSVVPTMPGDLERESTMNYRSLLELCRAVQRGGDLDGVMDLYADASRAADAGRQLRGPKRDPRPSRQGAGRVSDLAHRAVSYVEQGDAVRRRVGAQGHTPVRSAARWHRTTTDRQARGGAGHGVRTGPDGKIVVDNMYYDSMAVAAQLGLSRNQLRPRERRRTMPTMKEAASEFLANKRIAVTGVSRTPKDHGANTVFKRLRDRGYEVFPVNPNAEVEGAHSYHD